MPQGQDETSETESEYALRVAEMTLAQTGISGGWGFGLAIPRLRFMNDKRRPMTTNNPMAVVVSAEIDIHSVFKALMEFAEKYPAERLSFDQAYALDTAADLIFQRVWERDHPKKENL